MERYITPIQRQDCDQIDPLLVSEKHPQTSRHHLGAPPPPLQQPLGAILIIAIHEWGFRGGRP